MIESPPPLNILIQPSLLCLRRWEEAHGSGRLMRGSERVEVCPLQALQLDGSRSRRRYRSSSHCYLSHSSTQQWLGTSLSLITLFFLPLFPGASSYCSGDTLLLEREMGSLHICSLQNVL
jgi:hypothetical protein